MDGFHNIFLKIDLGIKLLKGIKSGILNETYPHVVLVIKGVADAIASTG